MKPVRFLVAFLILLIVFPLANAKISKYGVDATLDDTGLADVKISITFDNANIKNFQFYVFADISDFNYSTTGNSISCNYFKTIATLVNCSFDLREDGKSIILNYKTKDYVRFADSQVLFNADFTIQEKIEEAFIVVRLPEGMVLVNPNSYYPRDGTTSSDGKHIILIWRYENVENKPLVFKIFYEQSVKVNYMPYLIILLFLAFVIYMLYIRYVRQRHAIISKVLDEYEQKVYDIIKKEKQIDQRKVVALTNFSKARVSRIVKKLKERGLIKVERRGRTNLLKLA